MSRKIPEVVLLTYENVKQRSERDKRAYEESITNYTNKFISISDTSQLTQIDTPCTKQSIEEEALPPPLIYSTRADMEHDEKACGANFKRKCMILDEQ